MGSLGVIDKGSTLDEDDGGSLTGALGSDEDLPEASAGLISTSMVGSTGAA